MLLFSDLMLAATCEDGLILTQPRPRTQNTRPHRDLYSSRSVRIPDPKPGACRTCLGHILTAKARCETLKWPRMAHRAAKAQNGA